MIVCIIRGTKIAEQTQFSMILLLRHPADMLSIMSRIKKYPIVMSILTATYK